MKIVFMGTMRFAVPILEALNEVYDVALVVTQPDKPSGRKQAMKSSPVKEFAVAHGLPLFQPSSIRENPQPVLDMHPDIVIVAAYGQMIPPVILTSPRFRAVNVHASLLPKYRGGSPMQTAIKNGDAVTGVTIMFMANKMDSGPILSQASMDILETDDVGTLEAKLAVLGKNLLLETLPKVFDGSIRPVPQKTEDVSFAYNIKPEEERLDFHKSARELFNHVRAYRPAPLTYAAIDGMTLKVIEASVYDESLVQGTPGEILPSEKRMCLVQTGKGILALERVQLEGKKPLFISDFMNGAGKTLLVPGKIFI